MSYIRLFAGSIPPKKLQSFEQTLARAGIITVSDLSELGPNVPFQMLKEYADGFLFIPQPYRKMRRPDDVQRERIENILMINFFFNSFFVDLQIGDPAMRSLIEGEQREKKIGIFDPYKVLDDPNHPFTLLYETFKLMKAAHTISPNQNLEDMFFITRSVDEVIHQYSQPGRVFGRAISKHTKEIITDPVRLELKRKIRDSLENPPYYWRGEKWYPSLLHDLRTGLAIGIGGFTSARDADPFSRSEVVDLGTGIADRGYVGASGAGAVGQMGVFNDSIKNAGGTSIGWITNEVLELEDPPVNVDFIGMSRQGIGQREHSIIGHVRASIVGVGARGGAGNW